MMPDEHSTRKRFLLAGLVGWLAMLALSGWQPYDRLTWVLEVAPVVILTPILIITARRYPLTGLLYVLIFVHGVILMVGGRYSYARVPLGTWVQNLLDLQRNPYDKLGHFAQGFVPAVAAREILIRGNHVRGRRMLAFLILCIVLAVSATYEIIEWLAAVCLGKGADEFLGTQGDPFDTQSDMFLAFVGGVAALLLLGRFHDRQLAQLTSSVKAELAAEITSSERTESA